MLGKKLGNYIITERIGAGGMATVYKARQESLNRDVAIKVLSEHLSEEPEFRERFVREAQAIANLRHPHILPIHDFGSDAESGALFIVMEYVDGGTLKERMGNRMDVSQVLRLLRGVGSALDHAHAQGVIHRDVKPGNILLTHADHAFLADFGIAKLGAGTQYTQTGISVGTPAYMSPEQVMGDAVDGRSDQYAFAVMVFEFLCGQQPYAGPTPLAVANQHVIGPVPSLRKVHSDVPEAVDLAVQKALAKRPDDRFASISDFLSALGRAGAGRVSDEEMSDWVQTASLQDAFIPARRAASGTIAREVEPEKERSASTTTLARHVGSAMGWTLRKLFSLILVLIVILLAVSLILGGVAVWGVDRILNQVTLNADWSIEFLEEDKEYVLDQDLLTAVVQDALAPYLLNVSFVQIERKMLKSTKNQKNFQGSVI